MTGAWEPPIVTVLRRYWQRGASKALLLRLAGGPVAWRQLNEWWNIDGTATPPPLLAEAAPLLSIELGDPIAVSCAERRIALTQISCELAERETALPTSVALGRYFGVTRDMIRIDLEMLRNRGDIDWVLASDGLNGVRRLPLRVEGSG